MLTGFRRSIIAAILLVANSLSAHAVDEIQVYNAEIAKVLAMPDVRESFAKQATEPAGGTPEQFEAFMREESARWGAVVKQAGIKPE